MPKGKHGKRPASVRRAMKHADRPGAGAKKRKGLRGKNKIRAVMGEFARGTLRSGDNGLYVSTGGFTRDAMLEAERAREPLKLLDRDEFIRLLLEHYEALDAEFKAQVPLVHLAQGPQE